MEVKFVNRFPGLETKRLILRSLSNEDAEFIHFMRNDERVNKLVKRPATKDVDDAKFFIDQRHQAFFNKEAIYWGLELKTTGFLVGCITIWHLDLETASGELGYDIHPDFQRRGLMSEAISGVLNFGFRALGLQEITAICSPENIPSSGILKSFGFTKMKDDALSEANQEAGLHGYRLHP